MGTSRFLGLRFSFSKATRRFWRRNLSRRSLIFASICALYLLVGLSGYSQQYQDKPADTDERRPPLDTGARPDASDSRTRAQHVLPRRNNVVYVTLKSKRLNPAHIRGSVRPKLRRKARRTRAPFTQNKFGALRQNAAQNGRYVAQMSFLGETPNVESKSLNVALDSHSDSRVNSIRIYSQKAPSWFSPADVRAMRVLADAKVVRVKDMSQEDFSSLLIFEGGAGGDHKALEDGALCEGRCGVTGSPADLTEVFAFHLDRVLGLNRTLPAVSRQLRFVHGGRLCPVVLWDASVHPEGNSVLKLTWGEYQNTLKQRCLVPGSAVPKPGSICSTVHHHEWSKLALLDFLLQIHNRLDPSCCGFKPRREDVCVQPGPPAGCRDRAHTQLKGIRRGRDPGHLIFTGNKGFFDRNEDNLDFRLLEGINELPEQAVSLLKSSRLRVRLLQSLFLDQSYWESQGGRRGIDALIEVIERRAKVLLTYISAHGVKMVTMNE